MSECQQLYGIYSTRNAQSQRSNGPTDGDVGISLFPLVTLRATMYFILATKSFTALAQVIYLLVRVTSAISLIHLFCLFLCVPAGVPVVTVVPIALLGPTLHKKGANKIRRV